MVLAKSFKVAQSRTIFILGSKGDLRVFGMRQHLTPDFNFQKHFFCVWSCLICGICVYIDMSFILCIYIYVSIYIYIYLYIYLYIYMYCYVYEKNHKMWLKSASYESARPSCQRFLSQVHPQWISPLGISTINSYPYAETPLCQYRHY